MAVFSKGQKSAQDSLHDEEATTLLDEAQSPIFAPKAKTSIRAKIYNVFLHIVIVVLVVLYWNAQRNTKTTSTPKLSGQTWSPIEKHLTYEVRNSYDMGSKYAGLPTNETEEAWNTLSRPIYFNMSSEALADAGVSLTNRTRMARGGYMSSIGVLHELHCLQMFRYYIYFDKYYGDGVSKKELTHIRAHLDHCLDNIRASLMCKPNTKVITFNWNKPWTHKPQHESNSKSVCVNWDSVLNWAQSVEITGSPTILRVAPFEDHD